MNRIVTAAHTEPLMLQGTCNTRELGGYPARDGIVTQEHACLRSDALHALTGEDLEFLKGYGVGCVVDLRSPAECEKQPCALRGQPWVDYCPVPLYDEAQSSGLQGGMPASMGELYKKLLDGSGKALAQALREIAGHPGCTVIFNCTAGKDRTGVLAMLLLDLAGVPESVILEDYACSAGYMRPIFEAQKSFLAQQGVQVPDHIFASDPREMELAVEHLRTVWGDAEHYMRAVGLMPRDIRALREKLCGEEVV